MGKERLSVGTILVSLLLALLVSGAYVSPFLSRSVPAVATLGTGAASLTLQQETEAVLPVPVPATWRADIVGVLEGGQAYAFERLDEPGTFFYGYFEVMPEAPLDGYGTVRGLWQGSTCAYQHTVFGGRCVPEVRIRSFEPLPDELPQ